MKNKKTYILWIVVICLSVAALRCLGVRKYASAATLAVLAGVLSIIAIIIDRSYINNTESASQTITSAPMQTSDNPMLPSQQQTLISRKTTRSLENRTWLGNHAYGTSYHYSKVSIAREPQASPLPPSMLGAVVALIPEPTNQYDSNAIQVIVSAFAVPAYR